MGDAHKRFLQTQAPKVGDAFKDVNERVAEFREELKRRAKEQAALEAEVSELTTRRNADGGLMLDPELFQRRDCQSARQIVLEGAQHNRGGVYTMAMRAPKTTRRGPIELK